MRAQEKREAGTRSKGKSQNTPAQFLVLSGCLSRKKRKEKITHVGESLFP